MLTTEGRMICSRMREKVKAIRVLGIIKYNKGMVRNEEIIILISEYEVMASELENNLFRSDESGSG